MRSDKAISPLQIEADTSAFGSREAKLWGCSLQREAWDANTRLLTPLFCHVSPPRDAGVRDRGEHGVPQANRERCYEQADNPLESDMEMHARMLMRTAASNTLRRDVEAFV